MDLLIVLWFGTRTVRKTKERGDFFCPVCGGEKSYKQKELWNYCHMYYIPLCGDKVLDYVKCTTCRNRFHPAVLDHSKIRRNALDTLLLKLMIHVMAADGKIDAAELDIITKVHQKRSGVLLSSQDIVAHLAVLLAVEKDTNLGEELKPFAGALTEDEKKQAIEAMVEVSMADGHMATEELQLTKLVGAALGMEAKKVHGIVNQEMGRLESGGPAEKLEESTETTDQSIQIVPEETAEA